jgi:hypothetical protein
VNALRVTRPWLANSITITISATTLLIIIIATLVAKSLIER